MVLYKYCTTALCNTVLLTLQPKIWKPWNGRLVFYDWCPAINGTCRWNVGLFWAKQLPLRIYSKQKNKQGSKGFFFKIIFHKDQNGWKCKFVGYTWLVTPDDGTHPWRVIFWWHALTVWCVLSLWQCSIVQCSFIAPRRQCANTMLQCNYNLCNAWWWWSAHDSEPQRIQNTGFHFSVSFEHWSGNSLIKGFVFSQVTLQGKGDWGESQLPFLVFLKSSSSLSSYGDTGLTLTLSQLGKILCRWEPNFVRVRCSLDQFCQLWPSPGFNVMLKQNFLGL